jgi:hypothetical protein
VAALNRQQQASVNEIKTAGARNAPGDAPRRDALRCSALRVLNWSGRHKIRDANPHVAQGVDAFEIGGDDNPHIFQTTSSLRSRCDQRKNDFKGSTVTLDCDFPDESPLDKAIRFQNGIIAHATDGSFDGGDPAYKDLRSYFAARGDTREKLPAFVRRCSDLAQFWSFIKYEYRHYGERRAFIWDEFRPLVEYLEAYDRSPGLAPISEALEAFDPENVHAAWQKALDRRLTDPEGAITAARTLIETVCKHVLDEAAVAYPDDGDLPKLWALAAERLNLAPHQHQEQVFRAILGNCQSVVSNLGAIRNKIGDAHGQGRRPVKPKPRHAELAVNLAGAMAAFLISTWKEQSH